MARRTLCSVSIKSSELAIEARELAHEFVEATHGSGKLAQRKQRERRRDAGPQEQGEMRKVSARGKGVNEVLHDHGVSPLEAAGSEPLSRSPVDPEGGDDATVLPYYDLFCGSRGLDVSA